MNPIVINRPARKVIVVSRCFRGAMDVQYVGSFLILSASAQSLTPTLKLLCSLLIFFLEKITHKLIDQSKRSGSGAELREFRELGTSQCAEYP